MVIDPGLAAAIDRVVEGALGVVAGERLLIVHDEAHDVIAKLAVDAVRALRAEPHSVRLEDHGVRPCAHLPAAVIDALPTVQASLLVINFHSGELAMRTEMVTRAAEAGLRHGHMVGVQRKSIIDGFSVDPRRIAERARSLLVRLGPTSRITVKTPVGTDLAISLAPRCKWIDQGGVVLRGRRVNLPGGELFTNPDDVNGVFVADGTLGDADGAFRHRLKDTPVTLRITGSRVVAVECPKAPSIAHLVTGRISHIANLDRIGLIGFGVNIGLTEPTGDVFSDQKVPGVHLSLGESFPELTGAVSTSNSWIAATSSGQDVDVDRAAVLRGGRYLV